MVESKDFDIVGSYNDQRVTNIDAERSVNLFEYNDPLGKKPKVLINTPGLINQNFNFSGASGGARCEYTFNNVHYVVYGSRAYSITTAGVVSFLGSFANTSSGFVNVDANTFQLLFVDGVNGYVYDTKANTWTQVTDTSFPPNPIDVTALDGFAVVASGGSNNFQLSMFNQFMVWGPAANNFTTAFGTSTTLFTIGVSTIGGVAGTPNYQTGIPVTFSTTGSLPTTTPAINTTDTFYAIFVNSTQIKIATSYANAIAGIAVVISSNGSGTNTITSLGQLQQGSITSHPGNIVACRTLHRKLFLFSAFFTEVWENAGIGTNLPLRRNNTLLMEYGTPCLGSIAVGFDKLFFLSQDRDGLGSVMEVIGTQAVPVSNRALDFQLAYYATQGWVADCRAFLIKESGLIFYRMNFTAGNHTWVYGVTLSDPTQEQTKLWHEEEVLNGDRHPAQTHAYFNGNNYVGDYKSPIMYKVDNDTFTNAGEAIRRMRITRAVVPPGYQRLRVDRLQIDLVQGTFYEIGQQATDLILFTETNFPILTESGVPILLEQTLMTSAPIVPHVYLSISKNGGQTYGFKLKAPMGAVGQTTFRTLWRKLGTTKRGQAFVAKFEFFDQVPFIILGGSWAMEVLPQ